MTGSMTGPMIGSTVRIGTRGSRLALWQADWVKDQLMHHHPELTVELEIIKTSGDKIQDVPLASVGGKGLFVKEIEEALLDGRVDLAVHSMKDMPGEMPDGLGITTIPVREIPYDVLISNKHRSVDELPNGAKIGTSSLRRASQLLYLRPDFHISSLRGNLDTRLRKLADEDLDAIVLASAGVRRLQMADRISQEIPPDVILPAVGQGALCIETRKDHDRIIDFLKPLHHEESAQAVLAERGFLKRLQGGCQVPIAAYGTIEGNRLNLVGMVSETDGSVMYRDTITGAADAGEPLGIELAERLIDRGAGKIIQRLIEEAERT